MSRADIQERARLLDQIERLNALFGSRFHLDAQCGSCGGPLECDRDAICHRCTEKMEIERLLAEIREGDYWQRRARAALENGTCPICFATDEVGHTVTCPWGEDEQDNDRLRAIVDRLPKTADGEPIAPGDEVFVLRAGHAGRVRAVHRDSVAVTVGCIAATLVNIHPHQCYSTREAAEKASAT